MPPQFDHERFKAYQEALHFVVWASPVIDELSTKLSARDQLDRASTSIVLNLAEGKGKSSHADRCRYFDIARGSGVECAACLDVLVARGKIELQLANEGKSILREVVAMTAGLIAHFSNAVRDDQAEYGLGAAPDGAEKEKVKEERERLL